MIQGVTGGTATGMAIGNLIPGVGTVVGGIVGFFVGGLTAGSQLFSETDCLHDPVTGNFTCCNTVFNEGERQVNIGGKMFCGTDKGEIVYGYTRQCLQGGSTQEAGFFDSIFLDDTWAAECEINFCDGKEPPKDKMVSLAPDQNKFCWRWTEQPNPENTIAVDNPDGTTVIINKSIDPYATLIQQIEQEITNLTTQCGHLI